MMNMNQIYFTSDYDVLCCYGTKDALSVPHILLYWKCICFIVRFKRQEV